MINIVNRRILINLTLRMLDNMHCLAYETSSLSMRLFTMFITAACVLFLIKLRWPKNKSFLSSWDIVQQDPENGRGFSLALEWRNVTTIWLLTLGQLPVA